MQDSISTLTAPGADYEMVEAIVGGVRVRMFRTSPASLGDIYADSAARFADREFLVFENQRFTYQRFFACAEGMRRRLQPTGRRIAIAMRNRPEWLLAFVAITAGGGSAVLVNSRGTPADLAAAIATTGCDAVIADGPRARALAGAGCAVAIVDVDDPSGFALTEAGPLAIAPIDPDREATVIFTTGTSGSPKGAMLSHRAIVAALMNIAFSRAVAMADATRHLPPETLAALAHVQPSVLTPYPLFHVAGLNSDFLTFLRSGGKLVLMGKWSAEQAIELIERERIMSTSGSPAMMWDLLRAHDGSHNLSSLQGLGVGGQALPPTLFADVRRMFPNAGFGCGFGQTELGGPVSTAGLRLLLEKPGCSGRPVPVIDLRIVDEADAPLPAGAAGEIVVRGACVAQGYCNRPDETARTFRDGWVRTGDIGYLDDDGVLFVVDRRRSILISGGENISLSEIEHAAQTHADVIDAAAIGIADERMGEVPLLAIVLRDGASFDAASMAGVLAERLAAYKLPRRIVAVAAVPRNHMGKIDRAALRALIA